MLKTVALLVLCLQAWSSRATNAADHKLWNPQTYPNPVVDLELCGRKGVKSWICDPDGIITYESANVVEAVLRKIRRGEAPYSKMSCGGEQTGFQVAVALMNQFAQPMHEDPEVVAESFAKHIHDTWGVGDAACNNGVVVFLAIKNRQMYISAGKSAKRLLSYKVLGSILDRAKPRLRQHETDAAVETMVLDIGLALAGQVPAATAADFWDGFVFYGVLLGVGAAFVWSFVGNYRSRRRYQDCRSKLEKLKRDQAAMRARAYHATSCAICLEDFDSANPSATAPEPDIGSMPGGSGLRGSQAEAEGTGPSTSSSTSAGGPSTSSGINEPLLGGAVGGGAAGAGEGSAGAGGGGVGGAAAAAKKSEKKVERKPLVLPCGHSFCEPCISQWVKTNKVTCPICRAPIDRDEQQRQQQQRAQPPPPPSASSSQGPAADSSSSCSAEAQRAYQAQQQRMRDDLFQMELIFRLASLQRRYPTYITPAMERQWRQDLEQGQELNASTWHTFELNNPVVRAENERLGRMGAYSSFGGGSSMGGGGRGSSW